jgi:hypothetical protein
MGMDAFAFYHSAAVIGLPYGGQARRPAPTLASRLGQLQGQATSETSSTYMPLGAPSPSLKTPT